MPSVKARMFIGTLNNPDTTTCEQYIEAWSKAGDAAFATGQLEKGAEGTVHLQYFIHMKKQTCLP
ncbi:hypothetical protein ES705_41975 [subsurface metagenome]